MSELPYEVVRLDELDRIPASTGSPIMRPVRRRLGFGPAGINCWTGAAIGDRVLHPHREADGPEELYIVLTGRATFTVGEQQIDAPTGTLVFVPPNVERGAIAAEPETTVIAIGAKEGEAFEPSGWEDFHLAEFYAREGDLERARAMIREALDRYPDAWQGPYNAACFESLAGDTDAALAALERALELNPREVREYAAGDTDLDPIRADPRFQELVG